MEAICLLRDLGAKAPTGGALSEKSKVFWIDIPAESMERARARLPRLGYTEAVDVLKPVPPGADPNLSQNSNGQLVRWRRRDYRVVRIYEENPVIMRECAPDRRKFLMETWDGKLKLVRGYRGDGGLLDRRGLPVCDARLLVNLVFAPKPDALFLDPFAGVGGIVLEAIAVGYRAISSDIDPKLRYGLSNLGADHYISDARRLPFGSDTIDAVATEPPYDDQTRDLVSEALVEMHRVLKLGGRVSIFCIDWQAGILQQTANGLNLTTLLDSPINRKGVDCVAFLWEKIHAV